MKRSVLITAAVIAVTVTAVIALSGVAGAGQPPFVPIPAAANIDALRSTPLMSLPAAVARLSDDVRPGPGAAHALGNTSGVIWANARYGVCVLSSGGGPGGCFDKFDKPVVLYLWGTKTAADGAYVGPQQVAGVVPNSVRALSLVLAGGTRVPVDITRNGFSTEIPAGAALAGEQVTLKGGASFFAKDVVEPF
jgi:hypothetical protein